MFEIVIFDTTGLYNIPESPGGSIKPTDDEIVGVFQVCMGCFLCVFLKAEPKKTAGVSEWFALLGFQWFEISKWLCRAAIKRIPFPPCLLFFEASGHRSAAWEGLSLRFATVC